MPMEPADLDTKSEHSATLSIDSRNGENTETRHILSRRSRDMTASPRQPQADRDSHLKLSHFMQSQSLSTVLTRRMKSDLETPQSVEVLGGGGTYNNGTHTINTGATIVDRMKSNSTNIILYDRVDEMMSDSEPQQSQRTIKSNAGGSGQRTTQASHASSQTAASPDRASAQTTGNSSSIKVINSGLNRRRESSLDANADEEEEDEIDDTGNDDDDDDDDDDDQSDPGQSEYNASNDNLDRHHTHHHSQSITRCHCCGWLKKYKVSIALTLACWAPILTLTILYPDPEEMPLRLSYVEFGAFCLALLLSTRLCWKLLSYAFFVCSIRRSCRRRSQRLQKIVFYINHSEVYIVYALLSCVAYGLLLWFELTPAPHRYERIFDRASDEALDAIYKWILCAMVLFIGLFAKTLFVRWLCLHYYLKKYVVKIKKMRKYERWISTLLDNKEVFSMRVKEFLDINALHTRSHQDLDLNGEKETVVFRLDSLAFQDEFNLDADIDPGGGGVPQRIAEETSVDVEDDDDATSDHGADGNMDGVRDAFLSANANMNARGVDSLNNSLRSNKMADTLTSAEIFMSYAQREHAHNAQTGLLWLYNVKTDTVSMIDDTELEKLCKLFAKYILLAVTKNRLSDTPTIATATARKTTQRPSFNELSSMFNNNLATTTTTSLQVPKPSSYLKRAPFHVGGEFVTKQEFMARFFKLGKARQGRNAWKEINISDKQVTKKELQRWLYQYLHDLIFLKQTLDGYQEILWNLDLSGNVMIIFLMSFVFLLIFEFGFQSSVTTYAALFAVFAIFGHNIFTQWFDAIYFVFVLQPFEVGDVVLIEDVRYTVNCIHIMYSEMTCAVSNGNTVIMKNNALLLGRDIKNLSKTKAPYHNISFFVSQLTTMPQLLTLKSKMEKWIQTEMQNEISDMWFIFDGVDGECRMKISLFIRSFYAFSDAKTMWRQYHNINWQIRKLITEMGIQYKRFSAQDVQLSALIAEANKA